MKARSRLLIDELEASCDEVTRHMPRDFQSLDQSFHLAECFRENGLVGSAEDITRKLKTPIREAMNGAHKPKRRRLKAVQ